MLTTAHSPITKYPGGPVDAPLAAAAAKRNATPVQALFLWVRAKGVVIVTYVFCYALFSESESTTD